MKKAKLAKPNHFVTVRLTEGRKIKEEFFTYKSMRHFAKSFCNNPNAIKITAETPEGPMTLFVNE